MIEPDDDTSDGPDPEERQRILDTFTPKGTFAVLIVYAVLFALTWLYFWYGLFLPAGPVR